jgi:hypothetical protein
MMDVYRPMALTVPLVLFAVGGCSSPAQSERPHRQGPKVNVRDFVTNTAAYKRKVIGLYLMVDEKIEKAHGETLKDFVGKDAKFKLADPKLGNVFITIAIPNNLSVPEVARSEEVKVTFVCTNGKLQNGNMARAIERRPASSNSPTTEED